MGTKKKQGILAAITSILLVAVVVLGVVVNDAESKFITIEDLLTPLAGGPVLVQQTDADINVIPDKYNTGCKGELTKVTGATTINNIIVKVSGGYFVIDFGYANANAEGEYKIENMDFSQYVLSINNEAKASGKKVNLTFNNCKFGGFRNGNSKSDVFSYTFNDCSLTIFSGSNATFNRCKFGDTYNDCMNPFTNVHVYDCYFSNLASSAPDGAGKHSDGAQIFGDVGIVAEDIILERCRFEIPAIQSKGNTAAVNACVSVALERSDANNIHIRNCIANGGGYTFYGHSKRADGILTDVSFENIKVGKAMLFGTFYPTIDKNLVINNVTDQDSLYVSSVWKDNEGTHVIVSNDTGIERTLKVVTASKEYTYPVKACLGGNDLRYDNFDMPFSEFPFDVDIVVPEDASYVICYDATNGAESQIRFVNWSGEQVYVGGVIKDDTPEEKNKPNKKNKNDKKTSRNDAKKPVLTTENEVEDTTPEDIVETVSDVPESLSGTCGAGISFTLSTDGVLTISGQGAMDNFHSQNQAPWSTKMLEIKKVVIEDGVSTIGNQSFKSAQNLQEVVLPASVNSIGANSFMGCNNLREIEIGTSISSIGQYAFKGTSLTTAYYLGTKEDWEKVSVGDNNGPLLDVISFMTNSENVSEAIDDIVINGVCGKEISFSLNSDGQLTIYGNGSFDNYSSGTPAPWAKYGDTITSVVIDEGVTTIGNQAFRNAVCLQTISLPQSLTSIGNNAFIGCKSLSTILLGKDIHYIGQYAFCGTGLSSAVYAGSSEEFSLISVSDHNDELLNVLSFSE